MNDPIAAAEKPLVWMGSSHKDIRECPDAIQRDLGYALHFAQRGETHPHARPMKGVLREVMEIVARDDRSTYRGMYTVRLAGVVYVLHVFKKRSTHGIKTPQRQLDLIARRLADASMQHSFRYNHRARGPDGGETEGRG